MRGRKQCMGPSSQLVDDELEIMASAATLGGAQSNTAGAGSPITAS